MQQPSIVEFSDELAQAWKSAEHCLDEMLDVLRWRACLRHGFPTRNLASTSQDTLWTVDGKYFGATPSGAVDAVLRMELSAEGAKESFSSTPLLEKAGLLTGPDSHALIRLSRSAIRVVSGYVCACLGSGLRGLRSGRR